MTVEKYSKVTHLVSDVQGELRDDENPINALMSVLPAGTLSGAPKVRAMEIIDELEHSSRNLYTGSMGYLSLSGDCDLNIVIRTAVYQDGVITWAWAAALPVNRTWNLNMKRPCRRRKPFFRLWSDDNGGKTKTFYFG